MFDITGNVMSGTQDIYANDHGEAAADKAPVTREGWSDRVRRLANSLVKTFPLRLEWHRRVAPG
jgi:hypothetical protein